MIDILPKQVAVSVDLTVKDLTGAIDDSLAQGLTVTDATTKNSATFTTGSGSASLCVTAPPDGGSSSALLSVAGDATVPVLMKAQTKTITAAGQAVPISLWAFQVVVDKPFVGGSTTSPLNVSLALSGATKASESVSIASTDLGASPSAPAFYLVDTTAMTVTATPDAGSVYTATTWGPTNPTTSKTNQNPVLTLGYQDSAVTGKVLDSAQKPVTGATVALYTTADWLAAQKNKTTPTPITTNGPYTTGAGGTTGTDGQATFYELDADGYTLVATYSSAGKDYSGTAAVTLKNGTPQLSVPIQLSQTN